MQPPHDPSMLDNLEVGTGESWTFCLDALNEEACQALAEDLAQILTKGDVLALDGDVGMGKSTFARALLRAKAQDPLLEVPSPTFTLVQSYDLDGLELSHFDLYRISDFEELFEIGFEESWQEGCALVEWPDRGEELMPANTLWMHIEEASTDTFDARKITFEADASWQGRLERLCQKRQLLAQSGWAVAKLSAIAGDLSTRSYQRAELDGRSAILMDMPKREPGPILPDGRAYDLVAHRVVELAPMLTIRDALDEAGLCVPDCYGHNCMAGLALWEDFGQDCLSAHPKDSASGPAPIEARYHGTIEALANLHDTGWPSQQMALQGSGGAFHLSHYDKDALQIELSIFLDWYWPFLKGEECPQIIRDGFWQVWQAGLKHLTDCERSLTLRDVQDPNCFWLAASRGENKVGFIDFQDCLIGPTAYDVASLCMDARVTIDPDLEKKLKSAYMQIRSFDRSAAHDFEHDYALCGLQRTSKNLGAFARAYMSLGRRSYLAHIPRGIGYLARCLSRPELTDLRTFYYENALLDMPTSL